MGTFRLAAFDLDGTLFNSDAQVSGPTIAVLRRVAARGVHLVAATGRSHSSAGPRLAVTQAVEWAVCSNGATLYHVPTDSVAKQRPIPADDGPVVVNAVKAAMPDCSFAWETASGHQWTEGFNAVAPGQLSRRSIVPDDTPVPCDMVKLLIGHPTVRRHELLDALRPVVPEHMSLTTSGYPFLEASGPGVNKATSLAALCQQLGVERDEVVAFGDNTNDVEMLEWAGRGYAMANGHHQVVAASTHRTRLPCTEDGVADVLTELFLG